MRRYVLISAGLVLALGGRAEIHGQAAAGIALVGGRWFDGVTFGMRTVYVVDHELRDAAPSVVRKTIRLDGLFVLPPFGDAHTHHFDNPTSTPAIVRTYLREGTFYAKVLTEPRSGAVRTAALVNRPDSVDVAYGHAGLTSSFSHPIEVYEAMALGLYSYDQQKERGAQARASRLREGDAYVVIDSMADLERKWSQVLALGPDFVKIYLRNSECFSELDWPRNPRTWTFLGGGLDPALVPSLVQHAHDAGLRVTSAVNSNFDVQVALESGVDEISHLPGYQGLERLCGATTFAITPWQAKLAKDRQVDFTLVTSEFLQDHDDATWQQFSTNVNTLQLWHVPLTIGSDSYGTSPQKGIRAMADRHILSNLDLIRAWSITTPQSIFPYRRLGCLDDGCEASVIGLACNPVEAFDCVDEITFRLKEGEQLQSE